MAYETYRRAKAFGQRPSDVAYLDDTVTPLARFCFDRGIWAFGEHVDRRLSEVTADVRNEAIARYAQQREWERIMSIESSSAQFASPTAKITQSGSAGMFLDEVAASPDEIHW